MTARTPARSADGNDVQRRMGPSEEGWRAPPRRPNLPRGAVHLWCASLAELAPATWRALERTLAPDEIARAERYRARRDRDRFVATRGLLRQTIARYVQSDPATLRFRSGRWGKPALEAGMSGERLDFNVAHSDDVALFGIARGQTIGVDVERIRADLPVLELAQRFFSPREVRALRRLPDRSVAWGFARLWTAKEAAVKADGRGLSADLSRFDVAEVLTMPAAEVRHWALATDPPTWSIHAFEIAGGYVAALAVAGRIAAVERWQLGDAGAREDGD